MIARTPKPRKPRKPDPDYSPAPRLLSLLPRQVNQSALLTPVLAAAFAELRVGVSLYIKWWYPIYTMPSVTNFEYDFGVASRRWAYNQRCFTEVEKTKRPVLATHAGVHDLFVPVAREGTFVGFLVVGPFATARPTGADVLGRWHELTGLTGRITDPVFAHYLSMTLSTLTLEGPLYGWFERLMSAFAGLLVERSRPEALAEEAEAMREKLSAARFAERMWTVADHIVEEQTAVGWETHSKGSMVAVGVEGIPQHVVVGLLRGRAKGDPIDDLIRRDAYQRACTGLAQKIGNVVCGRVGDHGVVFLVRLQGGGTRNRLTDLASRAAATARRFDLELYAGIREAEAPSWVPAQYQGALRAAEKALIGGVRVVYGEPRLEDTAQQLRGLRIELAQCIEGRAGALSPLFERYIEAVLAHSGYRLELTRALLETGLERVAESLLASGLIDPKSLNDLNAALQKGVRDAHTVMDLVALYRPIVSDLEAAMLDPAVARTDRNKRRALDFIHDHMSEHLSLAQVAKVAGFAADYFSRLFRKTEGMTFSQYVQKLRIDKAKQMLATTRLSIDQVQRLSGMRNRAHFHRLFKRAVGVTPGQYREANPVM